MLSTSSQMCSSMVVVFVRRQQQQRRLISCCRSLITTTTRATTIRNLKDVVVVDVVKQQHQQQQRSLLLLNHPFSTMSMSYFDSNRTSTKRTMMTNNNNSSNSNIISNRGGAIIPNLLLSATNNTNENNNIEDNGIHLPPPDDPVGLQLYKKVLYCPNTNILRTSLHIGTDDLNQKVNGIVVGNSNSNNSNILGNDDGILVISSQDANNHARNSGLRLLSSIHHYLDGDLSRVEQIINVTGIVNVGHTNAVPVVVPYGSIIDGCSQVFAEAFGSERGIGTRVCYGGSIGSTVACYVELRIRPPL